MHTQIRRCIRGSAVYKVWDRCIRCWGWTATTVSCCGNRLGGIYTTKQKAQSITSTTLITVYHIRHYCTHLQPCRWLHGSLIQKFQLQIHPRRLVQTEEQAPHTLLSTVPLIHSEQCWYRSPSGSLWDIRLTLQHCLHLSE